MAIENMHYDFKSKLNKIDSSKYRDLSIPQIDWRMNEAYEVFIRMLNPKYAKLIGMEKSQRNIDDLYPLVVNPIDCISTFVETGVNYQVVALPDDYMFFLSLDCEAVKDSCTRTIHNLTIVTHNDKFLTTEFYSPSFEWNEIPVRFLDKGLKVFNDGTFTINKLCINYIKKPSYIHYAQAMGVTGYTLPNGDVLTGKQDCELPSHTHKEIVDIAVLIATGELQIPDFNFKMTKFNLTN